jgi:threonine/homoserine/homoserine lactone efflux protein
MEFSLATLAAFTVASLAVELTPGPNMVYLAILTLSEGRRAGYIAVAGVALGLLIIGVVAAVGLSALVLDSPAIYQALRWGGVVYLLWLAWDGWRDADDPPVETVVTNSHAKHFIRGLITNVLNPKAGLFYIAVLPGFIDPAQHMIAQTFFLSIFFVLIATATHAAIVTLAATALPLLENAQRRMIVQRVLSSALAGVAVWLAWSTRL